MENVNILKSLIDLGTVAILMYFLFVLWNDRKKVVEQKDKALEDVNSKLVDIIVDNTRTQSELRDAIRQNTRATETLTSKIYEGLRK